MSRDYDKTHSRSIIAAVQVPGSRFVNRGGTLGGDDVVGVSESSCKAGQTVTAITGYSAIVETAAEIAQGDLVESDADGRAIVATGLGLGVAESSAPAGRRVEVRLHGLLGKALERVGGGGSDHRWSDGTDIAAATQGVWVYPNVLQSRSGKVTYVGFADTVSGGVGVAMIDLATRKVQRKIVGYIAGELVDDHNVPALIELSDGSLFVAYAPHATVSTMFTVRMSGPDCLDIMDRGEVSASGVITYSQIFRIPTGPNAAKLALFYRLESSWCLRISSNEGRTWSAQLVLLNAPGKLYLRVTQDPSDGTKMRVIAKLHPVSETDQKIYHCVLDWSVAAGKISKDTGDIADTAFIGTPGAAIPVGVATMTLAWSNPDNKKIRLFDSRPTQSGIDQCLCVEFDSGGSDSNGRIYRYKQNATGAWTRENIIPAGGPFYKAASWYYGGGCYSKDSNDVVYMTTRKADGTEYYLDRMIPPVTPGALVPWQATRLVTSPNILSRPIHLPDGRVMYSEITHYADYMDLVSTLKFVDG